jgi:hypothetical protein
MTFNRLGSRHSAYMTHKASAIGRQPTVCCPNFNLQNELHMDETEYYLAIQPLMEGIPFTTQLQFTIDSIRKHLDFWQDFDPTDMCIEECLHVLEKAGSNYFEIEILSTRLDSAHSRASDTFELLAQGNDIYNSSDDALRALRAQYIVSSVLELLFIESPYDGLDMSHYTASSLSCLWGSTLFSREERRRQETEIQRMRKSFGLTI